MPFSFYLYFASMGLGGVFAGILLMVVYRSETKLPEGWRKAMSQRNYRLSTWFLMIYLFVNFFSEIYAIYLAQFNVYNSFVFSINFTINLPFFFGFLYLYTKTSWKRITYFIFYMLFVGYLISGDYYDPSCVLPTEASLIFSSIYCISCLLHLTDLLIDPKSAHFKFQLKINLIFFLFMLLASIATTAYWAFSSEIIFVIQFYILIVFYYLLAAVLAAETIRLLRRRLS